MKEFDAYLFDADGTIMDTRELIYQCFLHAGNEMGVGDPGRERVNAKTGLPVGTHLREVVGYDHPEDFYAQAIKLYTDYQNEIYRDYLTVFPGVHEGLARLAADGKKLAVVTSRRRNSLDPFLDLLDIKKYFNVLVTPEDTEKHKPDPEPALFAMRALGAEPSRTVFIGDAEFDIRSGNAAGAATVYVNWGGEDYAKWAVQPDFVAQSFGDLLPDGKE